MSTIDSSFVDLVGKHLKYIYSRLDKLSNELVELDKRLRSVEGSQTQVDADLQTKISSGIGELERLISDLKKELAESVARHEEELRRIEAAAARSTEFRDFKTKTELDLDAIRKVLISRAEFEEFRKEFEEFTEARFAVIFEKFTQALEARLPPIPPPPAREGEAGSGQEAQEATQTQ
jgi:chromosome segregation ATPase